MKYIFIDTNLFINDMTSNNCEIILSHVLRQLGKKGVRLVLPEVTKVEILTQYNNWKTYMIELVKANLSTNRILGITEPLTNDQTIKNQKNKNENAQKGGRNMQKSKTEAERIDSIINAPREGMVEVIVKYYQSISDKIDQIFKHKNTRVITLTNAIILSGMKRSLLNRTPYTRSEKITESAHVKDVDCIAFETLISFFNRLGKVHDKNEVLIMCVSDKDYLTSDGELHTDLIKDIGMEIHNYKSVSEMLEKEFNVKIKSQAVNNAEKLETKAASLAGVGEIISEELKTANNNNI